VFKQKLAGAEYNMQVVLPVKSFKYAKKRLAGILTVEQRSDLMKHMLNDVLMAIVTVPEVEAIIVVTDDVEVQEWVVNRADAFNMPLSVLTQHADLASCQNNDILNAPGVNALNGPRLSGEEGLCGAYSFASAHLCENGFDTMLLLPADIPLVKAVDITTLLAQHTCPGVSLVPASADGGTNALLVSPPDIIQPAFGKNSCQRHIFNARDQGIEPVVLENTALGLDVDTVTDVKALLACDIECTTRQFLLDSGIAARLIESKVSEYKSSTSCV